MPRQNGGQFCHSVIRDIEFCLFHHPTPLFCPARKNSAKSAVEPFSFLVFK